MWIMLQEWEDFVWNEIKRPLHRAYGGYRDGLVNFRTFIDLLHAFRAMRKLPEPTLELDRLPVSKRKMLPNTRRLIEVRDEFFALHRHDGSVFMLRMLFNLTIILYDSFPFYRHRLDWLIERLADMLITLRWVPRIPMRPYSDFWREWDTGGQYKAQSEGERITLKAE